MVTCSTCSRTHIGQQRATLANQHMSEARMGAAKLCSKVQKRATAIYSSGLDISSPEASGICENICTVHTLETDTVKQLADAVPAFDDICKNIQVYTSLLHLSSYKQMSCVLGIIRQLRSMHFLAVQLWCISAHLQAACQSYQSSTAATHINDDQNASDTTLHYSRFQTSLLYRTAAAVQS